MLSGWILAARQALVLIGQIEADDIDKAPVADVVSLGQRLWWINKHVNTIFDRIKDRMRREAGNANRRFEAGDDTHCMVIPQTQTLEIHKEADIEALRASLGDDFDKYFEETTSIKPRKDFRERVLEAPADVATKLLDNVTINNRPSRVVFKD